MHPRSYHDYPNKCIHLPLLVYSLNVCLCQSNDKAGAGYQRRWMADHVVDQGGNLINVMDYMDDCVSQSFWLQ